MLRSCRTGRRLSQLELATRAGTTQRHVSFLESGRSAPGRDLVVRLAESLALPLRERNTLLQAAGFTPAYPSSPLDGAALAPVRSALDQILRGHEPNPAVIVSGMGELIAANAAFALITEGADPALTDNLYRLALHPDGIAPRIRNLAVWGAHILNRLPLGSPLTAELAAYVPAAESAPLGFAVPLEIASSRGDLRLITTITTFATAVDVTLAELKLEAFLPADAHTARLLNTPATHEAGHVE